MSQFSHISAQDALTLIEEGAIVADIRDLTNFQANRIKGALQLSNDNVQKFLENTELEKAVIVCCYHGISSQSAAAFLCEQGFQSVYSLDGGFENWALVCPEHCEQS